MMNEQQTQTPISRPEETDASSADPDPGPLSLLILHEEWLATGDVQATVMAAYQAVGAKIAGVAGREVAVVLSSDIDVRSLNAQFRGKDAPTNVLSFPSEDAGDFEAVTGETMPLGDIIVAYETVMREARDDGKLPLNHLSHLTVHGLLHLAGFDHETDAEAEHMEALEREILATLNVPDPYSSPCSLSSGAPHSGMSAHD
jgi:probable rRNA maturation factor